MGGSLGDVNREAGEKLVSPGREDPLSSAASDWELAGELLSSAARSGRDAFREDPDAEKKLRRLLSQSGFGAESVRVWGSRERRILVGGVDLLSTRMGADDIRRLFESSVRQPLSAPEFEIDGPTVWMRMRSVSVFSCKTGSFSCAASSVHKYWCESRGCGADSGERDPEKTGETEAEASGEKPRVTLTDEEPPLDANALVRQSYPNLMQLDFDNSHTRAEQAAQGGVADIATERTFTERFADFYESQTGEELSPEQAALVDEIVDGWEA